MPIVQPTIALSTRQEAFCRHYAASGNAAGAARQAGYSERSARQTGCALLERPYVVERLRRIRLSWKRTERGPLAEAVRRGRDRAERALARHRESREELEAQEGFDEAAHEEAARRLAGAVEERACLPVGFETSPAPANDLPPADDPPEEAYEDCPRAGGDRSAYDDRTDGMIDDDRADGAEHDWLYQRRNGYAEIYDPWSPEEREERRRDRLERDDMRYAIEPPGAADPLDIDWLEDGEDRDGEFAPEHDIS